MQAELAADGCFRARLHAFESGRSDSAEYCAVVGKAQRAGGGQAKNARPVDVEAQPRGIYAGAFGWISGDGRADLGVVIRSLFRSGPGPWWLGTGGGITVRSDVGEEWAETLWKAARLRAAL